jgi:hypothetical protein
VFFEDDDFRVYLALIAVPLAAHRRHTVRINSRFGQTGHLWQGRFSSMVMDEHHFIAAARDVAMNPVRAGLTARAADWPWSSVHAHLAGRDDGVVTVAPILDRTPDWSANRRPGRAIYDSVTVIWSSAAATRRRCSPRWTN